MLPTVFRTWLFVCFCTLLTLLRLAGAGEFTFELPDNEKMCFYEFVQKGVECILEYQVNMRQTFNLLFQESGVKAGRVSRAQVSSCAEFATYTITHEGLLSFNVEFWYSRLSLIHI